MIDVSALKVLTNLTDATFYTYLQDSISAIRAYSNKSYITLTGVKDDFEILDGEITSTLPDTFSKFASGDVIELRFSEFNTRTYVVKTIVSNVMTVNEEVQDENFTGYIIKLNVSVPTTTLASMIVFTKNSVSRSGLKFESLDGYSYTVDSVRMTHGFPTNTMQSIKRKLPGNMEREYYNAGFIL